MFAYRCDCCKMIFDWRGRPWSNGHASGLSGLQFRTISHKMMKSRTVLHTLFAERHGAVLYGFQHKRVKLFAVFIFLYFF